MSKNLCTCGASLKPEAKFCPKCGAKVVGLADLQSGIVDGKPAPERSPETPPRPSRKSPRRLILGILATLLVSATAWVLGYGTTTLGWFRPDKAVGRYTVQIEGGFSNVLIVEADGTFRLTGTDASGKKTMDYSGTWSHVSSPSVAVLYSEVAKRSWNFGPCYGQQSVYMARSDGTASWWYSKVK